MNELRNVPIAEVQESKANPRRHYDDKDLAELTESIKTRGILVPLLLRPVNSHLEIVAGHRRFRAAKAAGLGAVPAMVNELSDEEAMQVALIDNLQRTDIHPLDEAAGYEQLVKTSRLDPPTVAAKVGKPVAYVLQRLALLKLIPAAQKQLWEEQILLGHALLIARLQPDDQKEVLQEMEYNRMPVSELQEHIQQEILCTLDSAAFDKKDPLLVTKAGACTVCPKRTGFNKELFNDITKKDRCTDPQCFQGKVAAHIKRAQDDAKKRKVTLLQLNERSYGRTKGVIDRAGYSSDSGWRKAKKGCPKPEQGIIVEGDGVGHIVEVCLNQACKVCNPEYRPSEYTHRHPETKTDRYKRRMEIWNCKVDQLKLQRLMQEVAPKVTLPLKREHWLLVLREIDNSNNRPDIEDAGKLLGVKVKKVGYREERMLSTWQKMTKDLSDTQLVQLAFAMILQQEQINDTSMHHDKEDEELTRELVRIHCADRPNLIEETRLKCQEDLGKVKPKSPKKEEKALATKKSGKKQGKPVLHKCEMCGCDENHACDGGCSWDLGFLDEGRYVCTTCADDDTARTQDGGYPPELEAPDDEDISDALKPTVTKKPRRKKS